MSWLWIVVYFVWAFLIIVTVITAATRNCDKILGIAFVSLLSFLLIGCTPWVQLLAPGWGTVVGAGGFISGVVALLWAMVGEPKYTTTTPKEYVPLSTFSRPSPTCPNCGRTLERRVTKCPHCNYHISGQWMKLCRYCGESILHSAVVCRYCKTDFRNEAQ